MSAGTTSPRRMRVTSPGTSSRAGTVIHCRSRSTRALTVRRRRSASTTPSARRSWTNAMVAFKMRSATAIARSASRCRTHDSPAIASSIQADSPQNFDRKVRAGCGFFSRTSFAPYCCRRASTCPTKRPTRRSAGAVAGAAGADGAVLMIDHSSVVLAAQSRDDQSRVRPAARLVRTASP